MSTVMVTVPEGAKPGTQIKVQTASGEVMVTIPEGVEPGQQIQVQIPVQAVVAQPAVVGATVVANPSAGVQPRLAPPGCQPGGLFVKQKWCGATTCLVAWLAGCFIGPCFFCACCCPCDEREVYLEPESNIAHDPNNGAILEDPCHGCVQCGRGCSPATS